MRLYFAPASRPLLSLTLNVVELRNLTIKTGTDFSFFGAASLLFLVSPSWKLGVRFLNSTTLPSRGGLRPLLKDEGKRTRDGDAYITPSSLVFLLETQALRLYAIVLPQTSPPPSLATCGVQPNTCHLATASHQSALPDCPTYTPTAAIIPHAGPSHSALRC